MTFFVILMDKNLFSTYKTFLFIFFAFCVTVEPVYSGHLWFLNKVTAITRFPLYRVLDFLGKKRQRKLRWSMFFIRYK